MEELYLGVLSGTSMDAIDIALISFVEHKQPSLVHAKSYTLPKEYTKLCKILATTEMCSLQEFAELDKQAGLLFAKSINDFLQEYNIDHKTITAIGSHGQTIKHYPNAKFPTTIQIGDPNTIAYITKISVIADFRRKDMSAGGQGAPLAPILHYELFQTIDENRIIINIGGISNISVIPKDKSLNITGYDTGPGNCLMDFWCQEYLNIPFDNNGDIAKNATLNPDILASLLKDNFFNQPTPKSTGNDYFNLSWLEQNLTKQLLTKYTKDKTSINNMLTTLCHFSAKSIALEINKINFKDAKAFVCGGGAHNKYLIELLNYYCKFPVTTTEQLNINPNWVEAMLFAVLAKKRIYNESLWLSNVTGSKEAVVLGGVYV